MRDKILEMLEEVGCSDRIVINRAVGKSGVEIKDGVEFNVDRLYGDIKTAWSSLKKSLKKSGPNRQKNWGNCVAGNTLEYVGEDEDYIFLRCVPEKMCHVLLAKKKIDQSIGNAGAIKSKDIAEILDSNKYDR